MMSVEEYAQDVNYSVSQILKKCKELGIKVSSGDDLLSEDDIVLLDNSLDEIDEITDEQVEEIIQNKNIKVTDDIKEQKLKKKDTTKKDFIKNKDFQNKKKAMYKNKEKLKTNIASDNIIIYKDNMTIGELANALNVSSGEIIKKLFLLGVMATINNTISFENAEILVIDYGKELKKEATQDVSNFEEYEIKDDEKDLQERPPVVTIMGHVDHGKTTLLDTIRKTNVALAEAGGITQAISAYQVKCNDKLITFIDTPGHAAFTEMRARGAKITDIIIIIVAADDGVMPQTKEVIDHAKAAGVPIIVAINKIDKPNVDPQRIMTELSEYGLMPDTWGGDTLYNLISAKNNIGINELLENILLIADMQNYKANPKRYAVGTVIESRLDKHLGPVVTVLVSNGTLRLGDPIVVGSAYGKVRTLKNDSGMDLTEATPSTPVEITGLSEVPSSGDRFMAFETDKEAKIVAEKRKLAIKEQNIKNSSSVSLDDLFAKIKEGQKEINVIIKADVNGSAEAVKNALEKIDVEGVKVNIIRSAVGAITESDVVLASASNAIIIGFNVRGNAKTMDAAKSYGITIKNYDIIYKVVEDMENAMKGMLDPEFEEKVIGTVEIRKIFKFSKIGNIAGCYVTDGIVKNNASVRIIRDGVVLKEDKIASLQKEKDTVKEMKKGYECGITLTEFNDIKVGDILEVFELVEVKNA